MDTPFDVTITIKDLQQLPTELKKMGEMYQAYQATGIETHGRKEKRNETPQKVRSL